jgi:hypothetical protein
VTSDDQATRKLDLKPGPGTEAFRNNNNKEVARLCYAGARRKGYKVQAGILDASGREKVPGPTYFAQIGEPTYLDHLLRYLYCAASYASRTCTPMVPFCESNRINQLWGVRPYELPDRHYEWTLSPIVATVILVFLWFSFTRL